MAKIHKRRRGAELQWSSTPFVRSFSVTHLEYNQQRSSTNYSNSKEREVPLYSQLGLEIEKSLFPPVTQELVVCSSENTCENAFIRVTSFQTSSVTV